MKNVACTRSSADTHASSDRYVASMVALMVGSNVAVYAGLNEVVRWRGGEVNEVVGEVGGGGGRGLVSRVALTQQLTCPAAGSVRPPVVKP